MYSRIAAITRRGHSELNAILCLLFCLLLNSTNSPASKRGAIMLMTLLCISINFCLLEVILSCTFLCKWSHECCKAELFAICLVFVNHKFGVERAKVTSAFKCIIPRRGTMPITLCSGVRAKSSLFFLGRAAEALLMMDCMVTSTPGQFCGVNFCSANISWVSARMLPLNRSIVPFVEEA